MFELISQPWPWYVAGPLIGLTVPLLLLIGNKAFGVSSNLRHLCAAVLPTRHPLFRYDWKRAGLWNLTFAGGILLGGTVATLFLGGGEQVDLAPSAEASLRALGLNDLSGLVPPEIFSFSGLATLPGFIMVVVGGLLIGFGTRYAGGCTSGHAITGLANFQLPSLIAVLGFFAGGLFVTHVVLPLLL